MVRTGLLSDENVLASCPEMQSIPFKKRNLAPNSNNRFFLPQRADFMYNNLSVPTSKKIELLNVFLNNAGGLKYAIPVPVAEPEAPPVNEGEGGGGVPEIPQDIQNLIFAIRLRRDAIAEESAQRFANVSGNIDNIRNIINTHEYILNLINDDIIADMAVDLDSDVEPEDIAVAFVDGIIADGGAFDLDDDFLNLPEDFVETEAIEIIADMLHAGTVGDIDPS